MATLARRAEALGYATLARRAEALGYATLARRAEALGYATLVVGEHVSLGALIPGLLAPIAALMAAAAATTHLRVASHVFTTGLRHPALLAQEAEAAAS